MSDSTITANPPKAASTGHRQIFKSTAIVGGAQVLSIAIGIVRNKAMALFLGPAGIGLAGTYLTVTGMIGGITGLGLGNSGVRQIAESAATNDTVRMGRTLLTLRRASLLSGILGMLIALALCLPLSHSTFGDSTHTSDLALMSLTLLLGSISAGQWALLQGLRRLGDLAKSQVIGAFWGMVASIIIVYFLRERGIALYLVMNAVFVLVLSWWYAQKLQVEKCQMSWRETFCEARGLVGLGVAFVLQNLLLGGSAYLSRVLIIKELGLGAVGLYTATWTLSSYYVGIVLKAMGTDFYPRLTAVAQDHPTMNRMVNEQIETGLLIATPGVLGILALGPWALHILYSGDFVSGTEIIRWQVMGVFLQVISWPIGTILLAKGKGTLYVVTEAINCVLSVVFLFVFLRFKGLEGIGIAFTSWTLIYAVYIRLIGKSLSQFAFDWRCLRLLILTVAMVISAFLCARLLPHMWALATGILMTATAAGLSVVLLQRLLDVNVMQIFRAKVGLFRIPLKQWLNNKAGSN